MFAYQETRGRVDVAFTDRHGGVSGGPYASLNLAASGGDDPAATEENIRRVTTAFAGTAGTAGTSGTTGGAAVASLLVRMHQVHGSDVTVVDAGSAARPVPVSDGLVTVTAGVMLMVRAADCVPVLLADVDRGVIGAAHAGRPGMVAGVVANTVTAMRGLGAQVITGWVGPHVCGRCYEVPEQMRADVTRVVPEAYAETSWGTPAVDIGRGVLAQLDAAGVRVVDAARCTIEDEDLFSYRRQGARSGRLGGLIRIRP